MVGTTAMTIAHVSSAGSLRGDLAEAEERERALRQELENLQLENVEVQKAGSAILQALEASIGPLMEELVGARSLCGGGGVSSTAAALLAANSDDPRLREALDSPPASDLEADILRLQRDLHSRQSQVERLEVELTARRQEVQQLGRELREADASIAYEQRRASHFHTKKRLSNPKPRKALGVGKRTIEMQAEERLREAAEVRANHMAQDLHKLTNDTLLQDKAIQRLDRKLLHMHRQASSSDLKLAEVEKITSRLHLRLCGGNDGQQDLSEQELLPRNTLSSQRLGGGRGAGGARGGPSPTRKNRMASTGRLPHLSF